MLEIKAVRFAGGVSHELISDVLWSSPATPVGVASRRALVEWLSANGSNEAVVIDGSRAVPVKVARPDDEAAYLRTCVDGGWTDHLLALPTF